MTTLYLARHGQTDWNVERRLQGHDDRSLSTIGQIQAIELGRRLANSQFDLVLCSDLTRARDTLRLAGHSATAVSPVWREMNVGAWTGRKIEDLQRAEAGAYASWRLGLSGPPEGESWAQFDNRIREGVKSIGPRPGLRVLIVTHSGVIRAALRIFQGGAHSGASAFANASITKIRLKHI